MRGICLIVVLCLAGCYGDAVIHASGWVKDLEGQPVANAELTLVPDPAVYPKEYPILERTTADGRFSILQTLQPKGHFTATLTVKAEGYETVVLPYDNDADHRNEVITLSRVKSE